MNDYWKMPDEDPTALKIKMPKTCAGGSGAIVATTKFVQRDLGSVRGGLALLRMNQRGGFDCSGCAWPEPDENRHTAEFCENGAKALAEEATTKKLTAEFFAKWSLEKLAQQSDHWLSQQGRLTQPLIIPRAGSQHYMPISWNSAYDLIAKELRALPDPNQAVFYTSGRASNEAAFVYQLFVRMFGTNNLPDCSNLCHESSGFAMKRSLGTGKGTVTLADFEHADCIFVIGQNPGTNHPRMLTTLQAAVRRGCSIVTINPVLEAGSAGFIHPQEVWALAGSGTPLTTQFVQVRLGGDQALFTGILKEMLEQEQAEPGAVFAKEFIAKHTEGFPQLRDRLEREEWDKIVRISGVSRDLIRRVVAIVRGARNVICCWAMGLTQQPFAVETIQEVINFLLVRGSIGRKGAGACPVRGHSNVQGDRTMGIWEQPTPAFNAALAQEFGFTPPVAHGYDVVNALHAMNQRQVQVFFALGGNFLSAAPDTEYTARGLQSCALTVHVATKLNRSHLVPGEIGLILPCRVRSECDEQKHNMQSVTVENSMGVVSLSQGHLTPISSEVRSEVQIICELAKQTFHGKTNLPALPWLRWRNDYSRIRKRIGRVIPGFSNFNAKLESTGSFTLPHPVRDTVTFHTPSGKAQLSCNPLPELPQVDADELVMMTIRSHDQFNTTIYGMDDRYRGIHGGRRVVLCNVEDLKARGLRSGARVDLTSTYEKVRSASGFTVVPYAIPRGCVATYFPETNCLVPAGAVAGGSNTPTSKYVKIRLVVK